MLRNFKQDWMVNMDELIFEEYERLHYNNIIYLLGFKAICKYCKDKAVPTEDIMVIGKIIEKTLNEIKPSPTEAENNA